MITFEIDVPDGMEVTEELQALAKAAAQRALADYVELEVLSAELAGRGIRISAAELLQRRATGVPAATASGKTRSPRKPALTAAQKQGILKALKSGTKASVLAREYDRSLGTIMILKRQAGLTKPRGK